MKLFDLLFPQTATAVHLRGIREQGQQPSHGSQGSLADSMTVQALKMRIDELEKDLGFTVLVLAGILSALDESGTISRADIARELKELDGIDGEMDDQISIRVLKQYLHSRG